MNGTFASTPLTNTTLFNSSPVYGHYPGADPISPLEARFPNTRNIGSAPRPQQIGQEAGPSYSPQYPVSRSEVENQFVSISPSRWLNANIGLTLSGITAKGMSLLFSITNADGLKVPYHHSFWEVPGSCGNPGAP
jgi:hypothetical protein